MTFFYPYKTYVQEFSTPPPSTTTTKEPSSSNPEPKHLSLRSSSPNFDIIQNLLPTTNSKTMQLSNASMLLVHFTLFGCSVTAVTISLTHKIADFVALITLLKAWIAARIGGDTRPVVSELTIGFALFPPREILPTRMLGSMNIAVEKFTTRRLIFKSSKVESSTRV
ncbi:hypothetical protein AHAS_Ahas13G0379100 [Arachis hypogaea]